jgi:hypothetical protein
MQRTRSSASPPHSPLMRCPLGRPLKYLPLLGCSFLIAVMALAQEKGATLRPRDPLFPSRLAAVTLERKGCYGTCPIYSVTLRNDDGASYTGIAHVDRVGEYVGSTRFQELGSWVESQPTLVDKSEKLHVITDGESVVLTIRSRDGKVVTKQFGTGSDRPDLWAAAEVIDGVASKVKWQKSASK